MTYTEKELKEIKGLDFNTITTYELDTNKTYLIKVEVEDLSKESVNLICSDLRDKLNSIRERLGDIMKKENNIKVLEYSVSKQQTFISNDGNTIFNPFLKGNEQDTNELINSITATYKLIDCSLIDTLVQYDYSHNTKMARDRYEELMKTTQCSFDVYADDNYMCCLCFKDGKQTNYGICDTVKNIHELCSVYGYNYCVMTL